MQNNQQTIDEWDIQSFTIDGIGVYPHRLIVPFLTQYGRHFTPQPLPSIYRPGAFRQCFKNAYRMALRHPVTYVEGCACQVELRPTLHAWCVDDHGNVLDRTWKHARAYFGVPIKTDYLKGIIGEREQHGDLYFGLLDDWQVNFPLIQEHGDQPELWLATVGQSNGNGC